MKAYNHIFINSMLISILILTIVVISLIAYKMHQDDIISMEEAQDNLYLEITGQHLPEGWRNDCRRER